VTQEAKAGAPAVSLRPARPADLPACAGVWHAGLSEYGVRVGRSPMPPAFGPLIDLLGHLLATDDRCPHMAAPLSLGRLDGCVVDCPLHNGRFDLCTGETVQMPTTGGLDADGVPHPPWSPPGAEPRPETPGRKAEVRRLTRVRRLRHYPVRVVDGSIEVAIPHA
jgi:nitrite reductase/ring-hydroxylating ferredoxin subunit